MLSIVTFMHYREQVFNLQKRSCGLYCHCKRTSNFIWFSIHIRVINFLRNWWDLSPMMSSFVAIKYWFFSNGTFRDKYQSRGADAHLVCGKYCRLTFWTYSCDKYCWSNHGRRKWTGGAQIPEENVNHWLPWIQEGAKQKVVRLRDSC